MPKLYYNSVKGALTFKKTKK